MRLSEKEKQEARTRADIVFIILAIFIPLTVWDHNSSFTISDFARIIIVPAVWYWCDVYFWPFVRSKERKNRVR